MKLTDRFQDGLCVAAELHRNQLRKGTDIPYVAHLMSVAALCLEHGADEDTAIAALLHDAIEDQGGDMARALIRERFGDRVLAIVEACTDADTTPKPPWRARKEAHLTHLAETSPEARLVVAADKLHNARALLSDHRTHGPSLWARFNAGREDTLWYYRSVAERLRELGPPAPALVDELARTVEDLARASEPEGAR